MEGKTNCWDAKKCGRTCDFYTAVRQEEFPHFEYSSTLLAKLRR